MPTLGLHALILSASLALAACGGGGDPGPQPLRHHLDDMYIAKIPVQEKRTVIEAQQGYSVAKMEHAKAQADLEDTATELDVAKNELKQAILEEKSSERKLKSAEESADLNRINAAKREARAAELARKAADEKVAHLQDLREYYKKLVRYTAEDMYHQEARYELAKAKLAQSKNIKPKGFDYGQYEQQVRDRARRAQQAQHEAKKELAEAQASKKKWKGLEQQSERMRTGKKAEPDEPDEIF